MASLLVRFEDTADGLVSAVIWVSPPLPLTKDGELTRDLTGLTLVQVKAVKMAATIRAAGWPVSLVNNPPPGLDAKLEN